MTVTELFSPPPPRRLDIRVKDKSFEDEVAAQCVILTLDGVEVKDAVAYDADAGWIDRYTPIVPPGFETWPTYRHEGKVVAYWDPAALAAHKVTE